MSTIGGLTSSTSTSSIRGYGGLASGLDRDSLIEQMTAGTQAKIDKQNQEKTKLQWEQDAIREITDLIYDFTQAYASYTSTDNLLSGTLFSRTEFSVTGEFSKFVSVNGSTKSGVFPQIMGVEQLAQQAMLTTKTNASERRLDFGAISMDLNASTIVNLAGGEKIYLDYGDTSYTVELGRGEGYSYQTPEEVAKAVNDSLKEVSIGDNKTLADVMEFTVEEDKLVIKNKDNAGNNITLTGGSNEILENLGFLKDGENLSSLDDSRKVIAAGSSLKAVETNTANKEMTIAEQLGNQSFSFVYNGTVKWIELPSTEELKDKSMEYVQSYLQKELDANFGAGRIKVELSEKSSDNKVSLQFVTTLPKKDGQGNVIPGEEDNSSTLSVTAATGHLLGEDSLFGVKEGVSNRLNLSASLSEAGLANGFQQQEGTPLLVINGKEIQGITQNSTIQEIINAVNNDKDAGVTIVYQENTDRFVVTSNQGGASGNVVVSGTVANALFGSEGTGYEVQSGKDAIISVKYAGSNEVTEITRGSNTITVDGLNITVNGTFGYDSSGELIEGTQGVSISAKVNTEKAVSVIKEMVEKYNEIVELVNEEVSTKPNRDYEPLTSSQKAEMSENEIELWEEQAKKGLLFADTDIRSLADELRFVIPDHIRSSLEKIGISVSEDYSANGKLVLDETKLEAALESDPESVRLLFAESAGKDEEGNTVAGGLMTNMKSIMDKYASMTGATKGILVERAGSEHSLTSVLNNSILDQMNEIDELIDRLTDQLETEQDRYISQFTQLETLISEMNSQSSWLSQMMGA